MMRGFLTAMLFMVSLCPAAVAAEIQDYDPNSSDWTGLSRLVDAGRTIGIEVVPTETLDYRELTPAQPVIIVYPQRPIDVPNLSRFVVDGGRVLLADDFGHSEEFLERLEIQRVVSDPANLPHERFANDNPALPVVTARGRHPLLDGVQRVVANHPSVINNVGGPVLAFDAGGGLVYDMNLGDGKVIVASDASLFINQMLGEADNEVLLANALRYICNDQPTCQPILLTREFEQVGAYSDSPFDIGDVGSFDAFNDAVREFIDSLPGAEFLYWLSLLIGVGLAVYLGTVFPVRRTRPYSAHVSDFLRSIPSPQSEFDWNVSRFGRASRTMNHALPMAILKETFEELFLTELGKWPAEGRARPDIERLGDMFERRYLSDRTPDERAAIRRDVVRLLATFAQIPPRSRVFLDNDAHFTGADLLEHHRRALNVLKLMGLDDEYERRTRGAL
jgi:hypothetical protein